jgi:hypothetical protein
MHHLGRAIALIVTIGVLAWSCSKPVAPEPSDNGGPPPEPEIGWTGPGVPDQQTARVRLRFVGPVVTLDATGRPRLEPNAVFLVDGDPYAHDLVPRDTVPALAVLKQVRWRLPEEDTLEFHVDSRPVFRLETPGWGTDYVVTQGPRILDLVPPARVGGEHLFIWYHQNFTPDWWWAGPDPSRFPPSSDGDGRAVDVVDWRAFRTTPAWPPDGRGFFGPDSFATLYSQRPPVNGDPDGRTFYEIWGDRIYARAEGDTVHQGAWLVFSLGGFDRDSPYVPSVDRSGPTLPPGYESQPDRYPLLIAQGLVGSPVGFRYRIPVRDANGGLTQPSETTTFPNFDVADIRYHPNVAAYARAIHPGKAYVEGYAVDSHHGVGERVLEDLTQLADRVDAGGGSPRDRQLRRRVLTFFVRSMAATKGTTHAGPSGSAWARSR